MSSEAVKALDTVRFKAGLSYTCPHCFQRGLQMRFDKKGRPYTACVCCGTRAFFHTSVALKWISMVAPAEIQNLIQAGAVSPDEAVQNQAEAIAGLNEVLEAANG